MLIAQRLSCKIYQTEQRITYLQLNQQHFFQELRPYSAEDDAEVQSLI